MLHPNHSVSFQRFRQVRKSLGVRFASTQGRKRRKKKINAKRDQNYGQKLKEKRKKNLDCSCKRTKNIYRVALYRKSKEKSAFKKNESMKREKKMLKQREAKREMWLKVKRYAKRP